jgi:hypothetical protein
MDIWTAVLSPDLLGIPSRAFGLPRMRSFLTVRS